jgi:hypothetical protein
MTRPKTKILVDGGDPQETRRVKELLGFVDGQTTNGVSGDERGSNGPRLRDSK